MADAAGTLGLILAGGQGARMGGTDKAMISFGDETLIARAVRRLAPQVDAIAVSANADPARLGVVCPVLADSIPGFAGPLAGILAGLDHAAEAGFARVATVAVDTPFFPDDLVARLAAARAPVAVAATSEEEGLRWHGTFALWPVASCEKLRAALLSGKRKVRVVAECLGAVPVAFPEAEAFFNVNTHVDLAEARDRHSNAR